MTKRSFDLLVVLFAAPLWIPLAGVIGLTVYVCLGRPILFRQRRAGRQGRIFELIKFRTMLDRRDPGGAPLPDGRRLTPFGRWLRATSLDELPEIWNVLRGEMSLVGPRPLLVEYLPRYGPRQARRHEVRPGLTGLAQVKGRNLLSWEEKLEWDVRYVESRTFGLDLKILFLTIRAVVARQGIGPPGRETMPEFRGVERK